VLTTPRRRLLVRNLSILVAADVLGRLLMMVAFVHLARTLQPAIFGAVEFALAVTMILTLVVDMGLKTLGAREVARSPQDTDRLVAGIVSIQALIAVAVYGLLLSALWLAPIEAAMKWLLAGYGLTLFAHPMILNWVFQGRNEMGWVALPQFLRQAAFAALALLFVRAPGQALRLPVFELVGVGLAVAVNLAAFRRIGARLSVGLHAPGMRSLLVEALPIGASNLIWSLRTYLPLILLGVMAGDVAAGLFAAPHRIMMVFYAVLLLYLVNLFPTLSQVAQEAASGAAPSVHRFSRLLYRSVLLVLAPALALAIATTLVAPTLVALIFGDSAAWQAAIPVLSVLIWVVPVLAVRGHTYYGLVALGRQRQEMVCSVIGVGVLLALMALWVPRFGALGAAWSMVLSELLAAGLSWWMIQSYLPERRAARPDLV
jgi:PST family polysaccharide transporter/O-antigen flippase